MASMKEMRVSYENWLGGLLFTDAEFVFESGLAVLLKGHVVKVVTTLLVLVRWSLNYLGMV